MSNEKYSFADAQDAYNKCKRAFLRFASDKSSISYLKYSTRLAFVNVCYRAFIKSSCKESELNDSFKIFIENCNNLCDEMNKEK